MNALADLQFLRPAWLLALFSLPLLAWAWRRRARRGSAWHRAVDPHLLPRLLGASGGGRGARVSGLVALAGLGVAIVAAAGPAWRSVPQPLQGGAGALVIALDLSGATLANDLPPSRLVQARARLDGLLAAHAGDVALVAYADDAFVVSPVTAEAANVRVFLDALAPDVMPVDGQRPQRAIDLASGLLAGAGHARGDILLLAPGVGDPAVRAAARAREAGHRVSVLAMGTPEGAAYRGRHGAILHSALDPASLQALAEAGGGRVHDWDTPPERVIADVSGSGAGSGAGIGSEADRDRRSGLVREDGGYWLLPLAMVLLLAAFRRGAALAAVALCLLLPVPAAPALAADGGGSGASAGAVPAIAAEGAAPPGTLWRREDQAVHARSVEAEAAYRRGDFEAAARAYAGLPGADAAYNRGNALARAGRYEEALAAYDQALGLAPGMPDALANRAAVEAAMRRQPPPSGGAGQGDASPEDDPRRGDGDGAGDRGDQGQREPDADPGADPGEQAPTPPDQGEDAPGATPPPPADATDAAADQARQQAADEAQREAMQRALDAGAEEDPRADAARQESTADAEREQANAAWLRRVPDDPGALLRARFRNEHLRRRAEDR